LSNNGVFANTFITRGSLRSGWGFSSDGAALITPTFSRSHAVNALSSTACNRPPTTVRSPRQLAVRAADKRRTVRVVEQRQAIGLRRRDAQESVIKSNDRA
jgi:hypothetical protein